MTDLEILHNTQNLVLAGSETTATSLATITYLLCTHPHVLAKFNEEVRSSFNSESEIDLLSVQKLDYVKAVVDEALRIFPPVVQGNTRITNEDGATIHGNYVPPHVSYSPLVIPPFSLYSALRLTVIRQCLPYGNGL